MKHYLDIRLRPDPEIAAAHLMNALFGRLHRALVALPEPAIGISFPGFGAAVPRLGDCLRLHGSEEDVRSFMDRAWLGALHDHVHVMAPQAVPQHARFRIVRRVQAKSSPERQRRRQMRRHGYDEAEAKRRVPEQIAQRLNLPHLSIRSASTGQAFRLFIEHGPLLDAACRGRFSAYGLSADATIPWF